MENNMIFYENELILNMMLGWGTYSGQFTYSITEVFYYITVVFIFVFYVLLVFTFYIFTSQGDRTYRRVRYNFILLGILHGHQPLIFVIDGV